MSTITISSTKDYAKFKLIKGNRWMDKGHVKKLVASFSKFNFTRYRPILVTKDMKIIDGQHSFEASKYLKENIFFMVVPDGDLSVTQLLNSNVRPWRIMDFCKSYAEIGKQDYIDLLVFVEKYELPVSVAANMLTGRANIQGGAAASDTLRSGAFKITTKTGAQELAKRIGEIQPFLASRDITSRSLIGSIKKA